MTEEQNYTFKSITLKTSKLSEQYQFYVEELGFNCLAKTETAFSISCGVTELTFETSSENAQYHFAFNIPENQIEEACAWVKQYSDIIQYEDKDIVDFPNWNAHSLYFKDPSGSIIEFIARHNLENSSNLDFGTESIIQFSEIGIPSQDFPGLFKKLNSELGFELYWGNLENFAAIGHEECLFITVPIERMWFPTDDLRSKIWPLEVQLSNGIKTKKLLRDKSEYIFTKS